MNFPLKRTDFALDIGTKHVRVFEADKGVVLDTSIEDLVDEATFCDRGERLAAVCRDTALPAKDPRDHRRRSGC